MVDRSCANSLRTCPGEGARRQGLLLSCARRHSGAPAPLLLTSSLLPFAGFQTQMAITATKKGKTCFAQACRPSGCSPAATTVADVNFAAKEEGAKGGSEQ